MTDNTTHPTVGALRVWHVPQVPGEPFHVNVAGPADAKRVLGLLAEYDLFQFRKRIKPDYSNAGGLEIYEGDAGDGKPGWCEWYDDSGDGIDDWIVPGAVAEGGAA